MTERLDSKNFFTEYYFLNPLNENLDKKDRYKCIGFSLLFGVFTLFIPHIVTGVCHAGAWALREVRQIRLKKGDNSQADRTDDARARTFPAPEGDKGTTGTAPKPGGTSSSSSGSSSGSTTTGRAATAAAAAAAATTTVAPGPSATTSVASGPSATTSVAATPAETEHSREINNLLRIFESDEATNSLIAEISKMDIETIKQKSGLFYSLEHQPPQALLKDGLVNNNLQRTLAVYEKRYELLQRQVDLVALGKDIENFRAEVLKCQKQKQLIEDRITKLTATPKLLEANQLEIHIERNKFSEEEACEKNLNKKIAQHLKMINEHQQRITELQNTQNPETSSSTAATPALLSATQPPANTAHVSKAAVDPAQRLAELNATAANLEAELSTIFGTMAGDAAYVSEAAAATARAQILDLPQDLDLQLVKRFFPTNVKVEDLSKPDFVKGYFKNESAVKSLEEVINMARLEQRDDLDALPRYLDWVYAIIHYDLENGDSLAKSFFDNLNEIFEVIFQKSELLQMQSEENIEILDTKITVSTGMISLLEQQIAELSSSSDGSRLDPKIKEAKELKKAEEKFITVNKQKIARHREIKAACEKRILELKNRENPATSPSTAATPAPQSAAPVATRATASSAAAAAAATPAPATTPANANASNISEAVAPSAAITAAAIYQERREKEEREYLELLKKFESDDYTISIIAEIQKMDVVEKIVNLEHIYAHLLTINSFPQTPGNKKETVNRNIDRAFEACIARKRIITGFPRW
jgi:hypothetical protein